MPTRPRIDIAGCHHIINRGIDRMNIFHHNEDKNSFLLLIYLFNDKFIYLTLKYSQQ